MDCNQPFSEIAKIDDREKPQECPVCKGKNSEFRISSVGLVFPGDGWATKNGRVATQMRAKRQSLTKTSDQIREQPGMTLAPNVGGERVESWSDAKKLARDLGKNTSSYNTMVSKEKKVS